MRQVGRVGQVRFFHDGQALAEAVIVLPLIVLFMLGMIQFGKVRTVQILLLMAARQGAAIAATSGEQAAAGEIRKVLGETGQIDPEKVEIRLKNAWIVKEVHLKYELPAIPVFRKLFPKPFVLRASCATAQTRFDW